MLKIGVRLPARFDDSGEYLADARAMDSAGVDSLWLDDHGYDPWLLLASVAAVTGRARLIAPVGAAGGPDAATLANRVATLAGLSHGRCVLSLTGAGADSIASLTALARSLDQRVIVEVEGGRHAQAAARLADGVVGVDDSCEALKASLPPLLRARDEAKCTGPLEVWARVKMPPDREQWRQMLRDWEDAGATGIVVPHDPRLLDQLRNGDEDDDRSDLQLAQG